MLVVKALLVTEQPVVITVVVLQDRATTMKVLVAVLQISEPAQQLLIV
jgi:ATP-dependent Clp protease adapter protein ClpS